MDPRIAPPFYEIEDDRFQCVCRDVLERQSENGIATCNIYGERGQTQYGVDLVAPLSGGNENDVAQCKKYKKINPSDIVKASTDFLKHLDYWKEFNVRRFILMVACTMDSRQQQDELQRQRARFAEHGIEYQWWDGRGLRQRLAPHPDIVRLYFPTPTEYWVEAICGRQPESLPTLTGPSSSAVTMNLIASQLEIISAQFSADVSEEIEKIRDLHREGRIEEAHNLISELHAGPKWAVLDVKVKARLLRVRVGIELAHSGDIDKARLHLDQAREFDPLADDTVARALLRYYESDEDATKALEEVSECLNTDVINLKLALMIESGAAKEALELIEALPTLGLAAEAGTHHLHALALLGVRNLTHARTAINLAKSLKPDWEAIKTVDAVIGYFENISPVAHPVHYLVWPEAVDWSYLKRDDKSVSNLREAGAHFERLAQKPSIKQEHRTQFEVWRLACLANDPERQPQAIEYCRQLLTDNPANHRAVVWAANRNLGLDLALSKAALEKYVAATLIRSDDRVEAVIVLAGLYLRDGNYTEARRLLRRKEKQLKAAGAGDLVLLWKGQLFAATGETKKALHLAQGLKNPNVKNKIKSVALREQLERTGKWKPLGRYLEKLYAKGKRGEDLFQLCELKAARKSWDFVADLADELVAVVDTADALRLAAISTFNAGLPARCLELLDGNQRLFPNETLSNELLLLQVACKRQVGALAAALSDAEELVTREPTARNVIALMDVQLQKADLKGLAITARRMLARKDFKAREILRAAKLVLLEDRELAVNLWREVKDDALTESEVVGEAVELGYALGLDQELGPLHSRLSEFAKRERTTIKSLTISQAVEYQTQKARKLTEIFRDYTRGKIMLPMFTGETRVPLVE